MSIKQIILPIIITITIASALTSCGKAIRDHDSPMIQDTTKDYFFDTGPSIIPRSSELY